jgi:hypothetical protein
MVLSIALVLGVIVAIVLKYQDLKPFHAVLCIAFGVFIASNKFGQGIHDATVATFQFFSGIKM